MKTVLFMVLFLAGVGHCQNQRTRIRTMTNIENAEETGRYMLGDVKCDRKEALAGLENCQITMGMAGRSRTYRAAGVIAPTITLLAVGIYNLYANANSLGSYPVNRIKSQQILTSIALGAVGIGVTVGFSISSSTVLFRGVDLFNKNADKCFYVPNAY